MPLFSERGSYTKVDVDSTLHSQAIYARRSQTRTMQRHLRACQLNRRSDTNSQREFTQRKTDKRVRVRVLCIQAQCVCMRVVQRTLCVCVCARSVCCAEKTHREQRKRESVRNCMRGRSPANRLKIIIERGF